MKYTVLTPVKGRETPSMYAISTPVNYPAGTFFQSSIKVTGGSVPGKPLDNGVVFVQKPDGWWIPMEYAGTTYLKEESVIPIPPDPTIDPYKPTKVIVENSGGTYIATDFTKV